MTGSAETQPAEPTLTGAGDPAAGPEPAAVQPGPSGSGRADPTGPVPAGFGGDGPHVVHGDPTVAVATRPAVEAPAGEPDGAHGDPTVAVVTRPAVERPTDLPDVGRGDPTVAVETRAEVGEETAVVTTGGDAGGVAAADDTRSLSELVAGPPVEPTAGTRPRPAPGWAAALFAALVGVLSAAVVVLAHVLAALRVDRAAATVGEAQLAAAAFAARRAGVVADALPPADLFAARQLGALQVLLATEGIGVVDAARWVCLAAGLVVALLLWPIQRSLGLSPVAAAAGVLVVGALPPAIAVHAGVTAAALATLWLAVAALVVARMQGRGRGAGLLAGALVLVAVLTAPLLAAALLALGAHAVADRSVLRILASRVRIAVAAVLGMLAVLAAAAALAGPLAGVGGPLLGDAGAVGCALLGVLVLGVGWWRARWLRPLLSPAVLLLAVVLFVPGPSRAAAAVLVVPVLALGTGVLVDELARRWWTAPAVLLAAAATAAAAVLPGVPVAEPTPGVAALVGWANTELDPAWTLRADALDRAEFVAAGFPAERLRDSADPMESTDGEVRVISDRPASGTMRMSGCPGGVLASVERGSGGVPTMICHTGATPDERAARMRVGSELGDNPALALSPAAEQALRAGEVDSRVMLALMALSATHRLDVVAFPLVEGDADGTPLRRVLLSTVDGGAASGDQLPKVRGVLAGQQLPLSPTVVRPVGDAVILGYPVPASTGLLPS